MAVTLNSTYISGLTGPAFSAYNSTGQGIVSANTIIQFNAENFDTGNYFDSTTNYRFTPGVAGYYQLNASVIIMYGTGGSSFKVVIFKNGSAYLQIFEITYNNASTLVYATGTGSCLMQFNGTTDYADVRVTPVYVSSAQTLPSSYRSEFSGILVSQ